MNHILLEEEEQEEATVSTIQSSHSACSINKSMTGSDDEITSKYQATVVITQEYQQSIG